MGDLTPYYATSLSDALYMSHHGKTWGERHPVVTTEVFQEIADRLEAVETLTARLAELAGGSNTYRQPTPEGDQ